MDSNAAAENVISAMSGSDCFDTVDRVDAGLTRELTVRTWRAMWSAVEGLCTVAPIRNQSQQEPPAISVVRTPRAQPYSFETGEGAHVIIDQHLMRLTHRWSRIAEMTSQQVPHLLSEIDDLYAERFYLVGEFGLSAYCRSSYRAYADGRKSLPSFPTARTEAAFLSRSETQHLFVIGHELAHTVVTRLPAEAHATVMDQLVNAYKTGLAPEAGGRKTSATVMARITESAVLSVECLCDALSIAALLNLSFTVDAALDAAHDALGLLSVLNIVDRDVQAFSIRARDGEVKSQNDQTSMGAFDDLFVRRAALVLLTNCAQVVLRRFGMSTRAVSLAKQSSASTERVDKILTTVAEFQPGAGITHETNTAELALLVIAMQSRTSARTYLGFSTAVPRD